MRVLFYGIILFSLAFIMHFVIWKIHLPQKNHTLVLLKIFFGCFLFGILISETTKNIPFLEIIHFQKIPEYLQLFLFYASLTLAYIVTYSAVEVDSPSLTMLINISKATQDGLDSERLNASMTDEFLVKARIKDLFDDRMIYMDKGKYKLTSKAVFLVNIFIFFRKLLNAPKGG